jgi:hypothetical protein
LEGAKLTVEVTIRKATKIKEMERAKVVTKVLGPFFQPFQPN